jgi:hypothetical protein
MTGYTMPLVDVDQLVKANMLLARQRNEAQASEASARAELETVTARARKLETEAQCLYGLLADAAADAAWFAQRANERTMMAAARRS